MWCDQLQGNWAKLARNITGSQRAVRSPGSDDLEECGVSPDVGPRGRGKWQWRIMEKNEITQPNLQERCKKDIFSWQETRIVLPSRPVLKEVLDLSNSGSRNKLSILRMKGGDKNEKHPVNFKLFSRGMGHSCDPRTLGGRGRIIAADLRLFSDTRWVLGQPGIHKEVLSQTKFNYSLLLFSKDVKLIKQQNMS